MIYSFQLRNYHEGWYPIARVGAETGVPYADNLWNYCDMRCLALERLVEKVDFFIITFRQSAFTPNVAVCYGKSEAGESKIWDYFIKNDFFDSLCGKDSVDYRTASSYQQISV